MSYKDALRAIIREYEAEVSSEPTSLEEIAAWAIQKGRWNPRPKDIVKVCRDELADAAREDVMTDDKGREVRIRHCVRASENGKQYTLWGHMDLSPPTFLAKSFAQRREQVGRDCFKLKQDVDHFNEKREPEVPFNLVLDFGEDVEEMEALRDAAAQRRRKEG
jgi:hypothetical protein